MGFFLFDVPSAHAIGEAIRTGFFWVLNMILYAVFLVVALLVDLAVSVLGAVVDAEMVERLFSMGAIYALWQMVRDFFNLFFILTLLFIAFCTIFQIQAYNYRKWLLMLVIMALLTNFSFPVTRFVIDATNVPMYFFLDTMFSSERNAGVNTVETVLGTGNVKDVLLASPNDKDRRMDRNDITGEVHITQQLLIAIIFIFLFGTALLVLALLFLIRWIMLIVLIIFSPAGFAGSAIPWTQKYAKQWWETLFKYALFGPAAALMLLISVKTMGAFNVEMSRTIQANNGALGSSNIVPALVQSFVPLIMIWLSISIGQTMGLHGASGIVGFAQGNLKKFGKGAAKRMSGYNWGKRRYDAYAAERKKRKDEKFAAKNIGTRMGRGMNRGLDRFVGTVGIGGKTRNLAREGYDQAQKQRADDVAKEHRINERMNSNDLREKHEKARKTGNKMLLAATTKEMMNRKETENEVTADDVKSVKKYFKDRGGVRSAVADDVVNAVAKKNADVAYDGDEGKIREAFESGKIKIEDQAASALTSKLLVAVNEANAISQKQLLEMRKDPAKAGQLNKNLKGATDQVSARYNADYKAGKRDLVADKKMERMHRMYLAQTGKMHSEMNSANKDMINQVLRKSDYETLQKMAELNKAQFDSIAPTMAEAMGPSKAASVLSKMADEGADIKKAAKNIIAAASDASLSVKTREANQAAKERMSGDYRFKAYTT